MQNKLKIIVNSLGLIIFFGVTISGWIIQAKYHAGRLSSDTFTMGFNKENWVDLHKVTSVIMVLIIFLHLIINKKVVKSFFNTKIWKNSVIKTSFIILMLSLILILTSFLTWFIIPKSSHLNKGIIEIHDKFGILLSITFIFHFKQHWKWIKMKIFRIG